METKHVCINARHAVFVLKSGVVSEVECITSFNPGGNPADQIEDTCLSERDSRTYKRAENASFSNCRAECRPENASHIMLHGLSETDDQTPLTFAIGWSDGTSAPTVAASGDEDAVDGLVLPSDRTGLSFRATFPISRSIFRQMQWLPPPQLSSAPDRRSGYLKQQRND